MPNMLLKSAKSYPGGGGIVLSTEDMIARHGLVSAWLGRRTLSLGRGGSRMGFNFVGAPFGGMLMMMVAVP